MGDGGASRFACELNKALAASGMSVDDVLRELDRAGFTVPERAFDNWLKGFFLPRSEAAGEVVFTLGNILRVEPSILVQALAVDIASGKSFVPGEDIHSIKAASVEVVGGAIDRKFEDSDKETDWASELIRVALEDHVTFSADMHDVTHRVVTWARVPAAPDPSLNVPVVYEETDIPRAGEEIIYDIEGAVLAGQKVYEVDNGAVNITSRLLLPPDVNPGDLHRVSFTVDWHSTVDLTQSFERSFPWPLERYTCRLTFLGEMPRDIEYVFSESVYDGEDSKLSEPQITPLEGRDGVVEVVRENQPKGFGWIQWA